MEPQLTLSDPLSVYFPVRQINGCRHFGPRDEMKTSIPPRGSEIFVARIPQDFSHKDLLNIFLAAGKLYDVRLMLTFLKENKGYAFVRYTSPEIAVKAINIINGYRFIHDGRQVNLVAMLSTDHRTLMLTGCSPEVSKEEVEKVFKKIDGADLVSVTKDFMKGRAAPVFYLFFASHRAAALMKKSNWKDFVPGHWGSWIQLNWQPNNEVSQRRRFKIEKKNFLSSLQNHSLSSATGFQNPTSPDFRKTVFSSAITRQDYLLEPTSSGIRVLRQERLPEPPSSAIAQHEFLPKSISSAIDLLGQESAPEPISSAMGGLGQECWPETTSRAVRMFGQEYLPLSAIARQECLPEPISSAGLLSNADDTDCNPFLAVFDNIEGKPKNESGFPNPECLFLSPRRNVEIAQDFSDFSSLSLSENGLNIWNRENSPPAAESWRGEPEGAWGEAPPPTPLQLSFGGDVNSLWSCMEPASGFHDYASEASNAVGGAPITRQDEEMITDENAQPAMQYPQYSLFGRPILGRRVDNQAAPRTMRF